MSKKTKITRVWIDHKVDESPDTSWLGEYHSNEREHSIDRQERGDQERGTFRYFTAANHHNIDEWDHVSDADVLKAYEREIKTGFQELTRDVMIESLDAFYREQDYQRMESLNAGQWHFIGVIAKAEIVSSQGVCQTIRSSGLWGVESDSPKEGIAAIEAEQLTELGQELLSIGLGERAVKVAVRNAERKAL